MFMMRVVVHGNDLMLLVGHNTNDAVTGNVIVIIHDD
jgi:hypothetical protein